MVAPHPHPANWSPCVRAALAIAAPPFEMLLCSSPPASSPWCACFSWLPLYESIGCSIPTYGYAHQHQALSTTCRSNGTVFRLMCTPLPPTPSTLNRLGDKWHFFRLMCTPLPPTQAPSVAPPLLTAMLLTALDPTPTVVNAVNAAVHTLLHDQTVMTALQGHRHAVLFLLLLCTVAGGREGRSTAETNGNDEPQPLSATLHTLLQGRVDRLLDEIQHGLGVDTRIMCCRCLASQVSRPSSDTRCLQSYYLLSHYLLSHCLLSRYLLSHYLLSHCLQTHYLQTHYLPRSPVVGRCPPQPCSHAAAGLGAVAYCCRGGNQRRRPSPPLGTACRGHCVQVGGPGLRKGSKV